MNDKVLIGVGIAALLGVLFFPSGSSQKVETLYEEAEQYMANERYLEAIQKYEESLVEAEKGFVKTEVIDPDYATLAKYKIAYAYTQLGEKANNAAEYDNALKILQDIYQVATVSKHQEGIVFLWGYVLFKTEKLEEAEPKFRELIQNFPSSLYLENAWYSIAQINYTLKDFDKARDAYRQIVDNFPNSDFRDDSQYRIAQTYLEDQSYEQSFREFDALTPEEFQGSPLLPEASYKAAYSLLQLDRLEEAIDRYNRFVAEYPDSIFRTGAHFDLGTIYTRQGDFDNALQNYQLAIENTENVALKAEIQYEIGDNYMEAENYMSAAEAYQMVIATYPKSEFVDDARFGMGEAYRTKAAEKAKLQPISLADSLSKAEAEAALKAAAPEAWKMYQETTKAEKLVEKADEALEAAAPDKYRAAVTALDATKQAVSSGSAAAEAIKNASDAALQALTTAAPEAWEAYQAALNARAEAYQAALQAQATLKTAAPEAWEAYQALQDHPAVENYKAAIKAYMSLLNEHNDSDYRVHSTYQIAEANYEMKRYEEALVWFRRTQNDFPDDALAPHALYAELWSLSELERFKEVLERGRSFIEANKDNEDFDVQAAEIQTKLGDIMFEQNDFLVAAGEYERAAAYPHLPKFYATRLRSLYQVGVCYFQHADESGESDYFNKALPPLNEALEKFTVKNPDPDNTGFNMNYEFPERVALLENSILSKAHVHEKLGQWAEARAAYTLIDDKSENYGRAQVLSAETYEDEGNNDEAINLYRAVSVNETLDETWQSLGAIRLADLLRDQKRWAEAATAYGNVVERYPSSEHAGASQYLQGVSYYSIEPRTDENLKASVASFMAVIEKWPDDVNAPDALYGAALSQRALAKSESGSWDDVLASVKRLETDYGAREDDRAKKAINQGYLLEAEALEEMGGADVGKTVAVLRQVAQSDTADATARVTAQLKIGNLLFENGQFEEAIREYEALGTMFPDSDQAPIGLHQAAVSAHKHGEALSDKNDPNAAAMFKLAADMTAKALAYSDKLDNDMLVKINYTRGSALHQSGNSQDAIQAYQAVAALKDSVDEKAQALVEASFTRLAQIYRSLGQYQEASAEYERLAENASKPLIRLQSLMARANILEENLNDPAGALANYQAAAEVEVDAESRDFIAQALYRSGLILSDMATAAKEAEDNEAAKARAEQAIVTFERLSSDFEMSENSQVKLMVADAGVRSSELYTLAGRDLRGAIAEAEAARDRAVGTGDLAQKVQAQYQVANLRNRYAQQLRTSADPNALDVVTLSNGTQREGYIDVSGGGLYSNGSLSLGDLEESTGQLTFSPISRNQIEGLELSYKTVSRLSAQDYMKAVEFAEPLDAAPEQSALFAGYALYQAGVISYALRGPRDLPVTVEALPRFVTLVDNGKVPKNDRELQDALYYLGVAYYDLASANNMDPDRFAKSADTLQSLTDRYPAHEEAGLWQYQVGEAHYAAKRFAEALTAYNRMASRYPNHASAPEALYSAAACHQQLGQSDGMMNAYDRLVKAYPKHIRSLDAFITLANQKFNDSMDLNEAIPEEFDQKLKMLEESLTMYRNVASSDLAEPEQANRAASFVTETEEFIASLRIVPLDAAFKSAGTNLEALTPAMNDLDAFANAYPKTKQAVIAWVRIADGHVIFANAALAENDNAGEREIYQKALQYYEKVRGRYVDSRGVLMTPSNASMQRALEYSNQKIIQIRNYLSETGRGGSE